MLTRLHFGLMPSVLGQVPLLGCPLLETQYEIPEALP